jgi:hypothetical protein
MDNYWLNRRIKTDKEKQQKELEEAQAIWNEVYRKKNDRKKLLTRYKKK